MQQNSNLSDALKGIVIRTISDRDLRANTLTKGNVLAIF